jgi:AraC-like DNA-binding protein
MLEVPAPWLDTPTPDGDPALFRLLADRLGPPATLRVPVVAAVVADIRAQLDAGRPPRPARLVAAAIGLSERSLVRQLAAAGTRYGQLADGERRRRAAHLLLADRQSLQSIAEALGYPDQGSFGRAWRRWHGESPGRMRRALFARGPGSGVI